MRKNKTKTVEQVKCVRGRTPPPRLACGTAWSRAEEAAEAGRMTAPRVLCVAVVVVALWDASPAAAAGALLLPAVTVVVGGLAPLLRPAAAPPPRSPAPAAAPTITSASTTARGKQRRAIILRCWAVPDDMQLPEGVSRLVSLL